MNTQQKSSNEFYEQVCDKYDESWTILSQRTANQKFIESEFDGRLKLNEDSLIIDYGGGSGTDSEYFHQTLHLKNEVLCIDPSPDMIKLAGEKQGVVSQVFDPSTISISNNNIPEKYKQVDLIFMSGCLHFLQNKDIQRVFELLQSLLKPKGIIAIRSRPDYILHYPFPSMVFDVPFGKNPLFQVYNQILLTQTNLKEKMTLYSIYNDVPKEQWFEFIRNKIWSNLENFTEDQIQNGLKEIQEKYKDKEKLQFYDHQFLITFAKKQINFQI